ncbi:type II toxin-antitoxin system RelE family toxin [Sulfurospirillum sp. 1307]
MYSIEFSRSTKKELKNIDKYHQHFIINSLEEFINKFSNEYEISLLRTGKIKKLQGKKEALFRLKLRSYRVVYKKYKNRLVILVLHVTSRESAYK